MIATHLSLPITKQIHHFCTHYDLFNISRHTATTQYQMWKEIHLTQPKSSQPSKHFLIVIGMVSDSFFSRLESSLNLFDLI
mgnify:CR=1 FL=1